MTTPGYSGRSLSAKLGIKEGMTVCTRNAPSELREWLYDLPEGVELTADWGESYGFGIVFMTRKDELEAVVADLVDTIVPDGMLWVSWPKRASKIPTEVDFEMAQPRILQTGLVDIKVCAVSDDWSGYKFMVRKELRKGWPGTRLDKGQA